MYLEVGEWSGLSYPRGSVVVGYNGKKHSDAALLWATAEAARRQAPLVVLFAANYPGMTVEPGPGLFHREPGALDAAHEVTARGVEAALRIDPAADVVGATEVTSPSQALVDASTDASVVVLGSRGYGRVAGALLGSVAFTLAARARCPVFVVKDEGADRREGPAKPVVVGTDGSLAADVAVDFAAARAAAASAPLQVITSTGGHQVENVTEAQLQSVADNIATTAATRVRATHPQLSVTTHVEDCPAEVTLVAASDEAGLVVVGTRGRGTFQGMLLGSVSHAVIHGARCAVAVVDELAVDL
jgi:nucleotide-binding universal stress UspA family protein